MTRVAASIATAVHVLKDRLHGDRGATAVEYGLLVGLIAVAIIAAVVVLGDQLEALFKMVTTKLADPSGVPAAPAGT